MADLKSHRKMCPNSRYTHSLLPGSSPSSPSPSSSSHSSSSSSSSSRFSKSVRCYDCQAYVIDLKAHRKDCPKNSRSRSPSPSPSSSPFPSFSCSSHPKQNQRENHTKKVNEKKREKNPSISDFDDTKDVYFLLDVSGSMAGARLAEAKNILTKMVNDMNKRDRLSIISFDTNPYFKLKPRAVEQIVRQNELSGILSRIFSGGRTALYDAVWMAVEQIQKKRRVVLIVLTDGEDNSSRHNLEQTLSLVEETDDVTLDIVHIDGSGAKIAAYERLCCVGNGDYVVVRELVDVQRNLFGVMEKRGVF